MPSGGEDEVVRAIAGLPTVDDWPGLPDQERERRERVLWDIALELMEDGEHAAQPSADRGRQFLPFDALKGYDEMIRDVERRQDGFGEAGG